MPKELLVIGSGAIGIEFASFFNTSGAKTTVVEVMDRILPVEDAEISGFRQEAIRQAGHDDHGKSDGQEADRAADKVTATIETRRQKWKARRLIR